MAGEGKRLHGPVALRHPAFRRLWAASFVSLVGTQMQQVALTWHLYVLTNSAFALGLLGLFKAIPLIVLALFGGVTADARDRRTLLVITQSSLLAISAVLTTATALGLTTQWMIYAAVAAAAAAAAFDNPARASLIPKLVPPEELANALSLNVIAWQAAVMVGPAIAGLVIARWGVAPIYAVDAASFLAMLGALSTIPPQPPEGAARSRPLAAVREGLAFVFAKPIIRSTMVLDFCATFFGCSLTLMPIFADKILGVGPKGLGLLYAAPSVGAVVAGAVLSSTRPVKRQGAVVLVSVLFYGVATLAFGLSTWLPLSVAALALAGASDSVSTVMRQTIRQIATPDALRGRMTSVNMIFFMGGPQLGELEAGTIAALVSPAASVAFGGVGVLATVAVAALASPALRNYRSGEG
jgi:MFS family permease